VSVGLWLQRAGIAHQAELVPLAPCLRMRLHFGGHTIHVLVQANDWAQANCTGLVGCAWELLPQQTVRALLGSCMDVPIVPASLAEGSQMTCLELVMPESGQPLPMVQGAAGPVWVEAILGEASAVAEPTPGGGLALELRLSSFSLSPDAICLLACNDVIQLGPLPAAGTVWLGDHLVHTFIFKDNHVEIDSNLILDTSTGNSGDLAAGLGSLSITLDVVLAHLPMTLSNLERLGKGSVLELPPSAPMNVRVRDAGRLLAVGELVQIGDQLGIQLRTVTTS
jgi:type III secretion protein Q